MSVGTEKIRWDLRVLYDGLDDPRIEADIKAYEIGAKKFAADYRGRLAEKLGAAIRDCQALTMLVEKVGIYLFLRSSVAQTDDAIKAKIFESQKRFNAASGEYLTFFDIELVALSDAAVDAQAKTDPDVAHHLPWIRHLRVFKPHLLSEPVESALTKRAFFGASSWAEFFDDLETDLRFDFGGAKKTLTEMLHVVSEDQDPERRAAAMKTINDVFGRGFAKYSAQALTMIVGEKEVEDRERGYSHPMSARNKGNRIPDGVVEALHEAVTKTAAPLAQRYYRLKASLLGLPRLAWSDRNAKLPWSDVSVTPYDEGLKTVLAAYESFSPTLAGLVRKVSDSRWIDAAASDAKQSGAYNYSAVLPGRKPATFVFLSYLGSQRDIMTLAHELGHAVHGLLAGEAQGPLMFHAPMAYAETASVFGEMTTFNFLKSRLADDPKARLALAAGKIDDMLNSVVRQIGFSNFERRVHGARKRLAVEDLNSIWLETARELYGADGDVFSYENTDRLWCYVSHFHRPFYVYAYAFGELLTQSLYGRRVGYGDKFEPLYLDMLRSGSSRDVVELLKPFGLDPADPKVWSEAVTSSLGALVDEAERDARTLGIISRK
ncbi:M3 family oligoendopeptidase [Candidatus Uhrbacteria bacterium]|nr:M3 family oligoendopeptidase [Candidatus Uhrbacteria bacterium]